MANKKPAKKRAEKLAEAAPPPPPPTPTPPPEPPLDIDANGEPITTEERARWDAASAKHDPQPEPVQTSEADTASAAESDADPLDLHLWPSGTTTYQEPLRHTWDKAPEPVLTETGEPHPWHDPLTFATDLERHALHSYGLSSDTDLIRKVAAFIRAAAGLAPATA